MIKKGADIVSKLVAKSCHVTQEKHQLALRRDDDLKNISHLRIYDATHDYEIWYSVIKSQDLTTNKTDFARDCWTPTNLFILQSTTQIFD